MIQLYRYLRSAGFERWKALCWSVHIRCIRARAKRILRLGALTSNLEKIREKERRYREARNG